MSNNKHFYVNAVTNIHFIKTVKFVCVNISNYNPTFINHNQNKSSDKSAGSACEQLFFQQQI